MTISVNPSVLVWARETAGFSLDEAADKLGFGDSAKNTAVEKLATMESGEKLPSRTQLNKFSNVYKRPLLVFYMAEPPRTGRRGQNFRQSPDSRTARQNVILDTLLRDVKARQETVRDILLDDDDFETLDYVAPMSIQSGVASVVADISRWLGFDHTDLTLRRGNPDDLFKRLRAAAEEIGIFVMLMSDVGSWRSTIDARVFRGFAIADDVAPFVVINTKDAKAARAFTLIHELAHIWLGQTGVSGAVSSNNPLSENAKSEQFCNDVAGEFLLPDGKFKGHAPVFDPSDLDTAQSMIDAIAVCWSVSEPMVAYRLARRGELSAGAYQSLRAICFARWQANLKREKAKQKDSAGPDRHVLTQHHLGKAFIEMVYRTVRGNTLTYTKAANLLGAKPNAVEPLLRKYEAKRSGGDLFSNANSAA